MPRMNLGATAANGTLWAGREILHIKLVCSKTTIESPKAAIDSNDDVREPGISETGIGASENDETSRSRLCRCSGSCMRMGPEETGSCDLRSNVEDNEES